MSRLEPVAMRQAKGARKRLLHEKTGARVPKPKVVLPPRPPGLNDVAGEVWDRLSRDLYTSQVLTSFDVFGLERICRLWAEVDRYGKFLEENGLTYEYLNDKGVVVTKERPEQRMYSQCDARLMQYLAQYGLTPAARNRVSAQGEPREDAESPEAAYFAEAA